MPERILVNVAWPYASGPRHLGHVAGFGVPSDIFARYHRLKGNQVLMVSGTDEHGTPILVAADREGSTPKEIADRYNRVIGDDLVKLGLSYDLFTRTTTRNHYEVVQQVFKDLYDKGYLIKQTTLAAFSAATGRTLPDRYIEGTCPICGFPEARGDQCDNCGNQLDPTDLIEPRSRIDGQPPVFKETEHFFLDLPAFGTRLQEWLATKETYWRPNVINFTRNLLPELKPRPITRDLDWGVPIPLPGWEERDDKRIYVWFDAVLGYLSASIEWAKLQGRPDDWKLWWQNPAARHYYFMGKDNIVFHSVIWPVILLGHGLELPYDIVASEFLTMEGRKFSASRGVAILVNDFLARYDPDPLRYFLTIAGPETQDTDFTWTEFVRRNNDELVATWGNLVHRTLVNAHRNFGEVPEPGKMSPADELLLREIEGALDYVAEQLAEARFQNALKHAMAMASKVNVYLGTEQPWHTIKTDRERAGTVLYVALRCVDNLKTMLTPFLPFSSQRLHAMLGYEDVIAPQPEVRQFFEDGTSHRVITGEYEAVDRWLPSRLEAGRKLPPPQALFKRLDDLPEEEPPASS